MTHPCTRPPTLPYPCTWPQNRRMDGPAAANAHRATQGTHDTCPAATNSQQSRKHENPLLQSDPKVLAAVRSPNAPRSVLHVSAATHIHAGTGVHTQHPAVQGRSKPLTPRPVAQAIHSHTVRKPYEVRSPRTSHLPWHPAGPDCSGNCLTRSPTRPLTLARRMPSQYPGRHRAGPQTLSRLWRGGASQGSLQHGEARPSTRRLLLPLQQPAARWQPDPWPAPVDLETLARQLPLPPCRRAAPRCSTAAHTCKALGRAAPLR